MTQYDATMPNVLVAFKPQSLTNTFGEYISDKGLTQLRIAETEKYAHVTFFFNGALKSNTRMKIAYWSTLRRWPHMIYSQK